MAKCLSRQFISKVEKVCASYKFAMSARAGTDCVGHAIRATTDHNPRTTVLLIDRVGPYDLVLRSAMLSKLLEVESLRGLLFFVWSAHSCPSVYHGQQEGGGQKRQIRQIEGGQQGDPSYAARRFRSGPGASAGRRSDFRFLSMTCTCRPLPGSLRSCTTWQGFVCMLAKHERGTK